MFYFDDNVQVISKCNKFYILFFLMSRHREKEFSIKSCMKIYENVTRMASQNSIDLWLY